MKLIGMNVTWSQLTACYTVKNSFVIGVALTKGGG